MSQKSKIRSWKKVSRSILLEHPRLTFIEDIVELPDGKRVPYLLYGMDAKSVTVICVRNNKILLQEEYSYPTDSVLYQFPGGKVNASETPKSAAIRELSEESKISPKVLNELGWYYVNNRRSNAKMFVFVAEKFTKNNLRTGDLEEEIASIWIPIAEFEKMIQHGEIVNYSVLSAWALYKSKYS